MAAKRKTARQVAASRRNLAKARAKKKGRFSSFKSGARKVLIASAAIGGAGALGYAMGRGNKKHQKFRTAYRKRVSIKKNKARLLPEGKKNRHRRRYVKGK